MANQNGRNYSDDNRASESPKFRTWEDREQRLAGNDEPWSYEQHRPHDWHGRNHGSESDRGRDYGRGYGSDYDRSRSYNSYSRDDDRGTYRGGSSDRGGYYRDRGSESGGGNYGNRNTYGGGSYGEGYGGDFDERRYGQRQQRGPHAGKGPQGFQRSDDRIKELVSEALTDDDSIDATHIVVDVKDGEVTLTGGIEDRRMKRMVLDLVEGISGVKDVHNQLRLGGEPPRSSGKLS